MSKQKPLKPNAFILFVLERKKELEKDGQQFSGLSDAVEKFGPDWKMMSKDDRAPYEKKAKEKKEELQEKQQKRRIQVSAPVYGFGNYSYSPTSRGPPSGGYPA